MIESRSIIELSAEEAKNFFLKHESYCSIDLPDYINFDEILTKLSDEIRQDKLKEICSNYRENKPKDIEQINHILLTNKDGKFAWRPLMLIHPVIYILITNVISKTENWDVLVDRFNTIRSEISDKIECISLPVVSSTDDSDKAAQIDKWWNQVEQQSLILSLDYFYISHTDITNCYGSIYTHSIPWAIHGKEECKANIQKSPQDRDYMFGDDIDLLIRSTSYGQTNGIPQGSVLMDFIAEIVLNYIDLEIYKKIEGIDCKIIRYRDDYRVFTQNEIDSLKILKAISEVTAQLGLKMNEKKTLISNEIIKDSLKPDKWYYIDSLDCSRKRQKIQKHLLLIHKLSLEHPNSGSVRKELFNFYKRLFKKDRLNEDINVLISIISDIAFNNPSTYPVSSAILSKLLSMISESDQEHYVDKLIKRFDSIPNTGLVDIWLQRITIATVILKDKAFDEIICDIVKDQKSNFDLWDSSWLQQRFVDLINQIRIIDQDRIEELTPIISIEEIELFKVDY